jgi:hypothetical protein
MDETLNGFLVAARENEAESLNENTQMVCLLEKMTAALRDAAGLNPDLTRKGLNPLEAILLANLCRDVQPDFEVGRSSIGRRCHPSICGRASGGPSPSAKFAADSSLEESGFELSVPP